MKRTMQLLCAGLLLVAGMALLAGGQTPPVGAGSPEAARVLEVRIDDAIFPVQADFVKDAFDEAVRTNARLVLITMNTPGGLDSSMREIIQRIISSPIPVAVYVSPAGTRAASAGFYILLSADIAAMAPGTNTGAASPIFVLGGQPVQIDETLRKKAMNDAAAYLRSITGKRGRNPQLAELAVTEAKAFTEKEALDGKLIDLIAPSTEDLLGQLNGREIRRFDGSTVKLSLPSPVRTSFEMSTRQRLLDRIARPDVLFILVILAVLGLYMEFNNPGLILPGVVGGVSLILALVAMQILPINAVGVLLILLAIVLFVLEAKVTSHGLLAIGGIAAMIVGALLLIKSPITGHGVSLKVAVIMTLPFALITVFLMRQVFKSFSWKPSTGMEQMAGVSGEVTTAAETPQADGAYHGQAFVQGALWSVVAAQPLPKGARVRVLKTEGLTLHVELAGTPQAAAAAATTKDV
ncbi:MAG: nodulation protein NfeD [Acidobacteria bacterium]|nr:nodulation protein NfeD [Acidobacteriota bacterium]MBI3662435.1 nodulation protein NfeD [Acidobacteriota bacterium]